MESASETDIFLNYLFYDSYKVTSSAMIGKVCVYGEFWKFYCGVSFLNNEGGPRWW